MPLLVKLLVRPVSDDTEHGSERWNSSLPAKEFNWWLGVYNRAMGPNENKMSDSGRGGASRAEKGK